MSTDDRIKIKIKKATGRETVMVGPGVHHIDIDIDRINKGVLGEFVQGLVEEFGSFRNLTTADIVGMAIGRFDVPISDIYNGKVESLSALDDRTLAQVFRFREEHNRN